MPGPTDAAAERPHAATLKTRLVLWAQRRPTAAAAAFYGVLAFVLFVPGLAPGMTLSASDFLWTATPWDSIRPPEVPGLGSNRELLDEVILFQPQLQYTRAALPDVPLWDPHLLGGRTWMGDPQSSVFSVFSFPSYVLPFWKSLAVVAMLKVFLAALGAFLLGRAVGMGPGGALICGLAFGFGLWSVSWVSWTLGSVWTLVPWICLFCELCLRRPGPLPWAGVALATGVGWLGGHPSSSFQVLVVIVLFFAVRALVASDLRPQLALRLLTVGSGLVAGTALAAVMLVPFAELLAHSGDAGARADVAKALFHEEPRRLLGFALHDWWGAGQTSIEFAATTQEHYYYVGALPLMLAVAALIARPRPVRIAMALVGAFAILVATGVAPLFDLVVSLPGFEAANNGRLAVITVLCLALLAGWGFDELAGSRPKAVRRRLGVVGVAAALLVLPALYALLGGHVNTDVVGRAVRAAWLFQEPGAELVGSPQGPDVVRLASLLEWLVPASLAAALVAARLLGRLPVPAFAGLAVALVALDLLKAGAGYNPAIEQRYAQQPTTAAISYLQGKRPERFAGLAATAPATLSPPLPPNTALRYGVFDARGNVIPTEERYVELWRRAIVGQPGCYSFFCTVAATATPQSFRALGLVGANYLLQSRRDVPLDGLRTVYSGPDARIYRNPAALPRAFLVDRQVVLPDADAQLAAVTAPGFSARAAAVTESKLPGLPEGASAQRPPGSARITEYGDEQVSVRTAAARPTLLVLTDNWYPGWKARVDGREVDVHRVDYLARGVLVPTGAHRVDFAYEPVSWRIGWILSALTLVVLAAAAVIGWRRRRPAERTPATTGTFEA